MSRYSGWTDGPSEWLNLRAFPPAPYAIVKMNGQVLATCDILEQARALRSEKFNFPHTAVFIRRTDTGEHV